MSNRWIEIVSRLEQARKQLAGAHDELAALAAELGPGEARIAAQQARLSVEAIITFTQEQQRRVMEQDIQRSAEEKAAFDEGWAARRMGDDRNPHLGKHMDLSTAWAKGWAAQRDHEDGATVKSGLDNEPAVLARIRVCSHGGGCLCAEEPFDYDAIEATR